MHKQKLERFKQLHCTNKPLILTNVWDAASAAMVAQIGAPAIATSSASLCWSLGYQDGHQIPFAVLLAAIKRISQVTDVPLTVDVEAGYSEDPKQVAAQVAALTALGVVGINIEDGNGSVEAMVAKIAAITDLGDHAPFINARTDVYLRALTAPEDGLDEALRRAQVYQGAGASGIFIPGVDDLNEIKRLAQGIELPLNVMVNELPEDAAVFSNLGVARISTGPAPFLNAYQQLAHWVRHAACKPNQPTLQYADVNALFG